MSKRPTASSNEVVAPRSRGRISPDAVQQLLAAMREEFDAYRTRTDAIIAELLAAVNTLRTHNVSPSLSLPIGDLEGAARRPGNWMTVKDLAHAIGKSEENVRKMIRQKKLDVYQPGGPRTALEVNADRLPPKVRLVQRSTKMAHRPSD
jgi:hypothetical protein